MTSAPIETPVRLIYESKPFFRRPSFIPTVITVLGVGTVVGLLIMSAFHRLNSYGPVALLMILSTSIIALYLAVFTKKWLHDLSRHYTLAVTERGVIFSMHDRLHGKRNKVMMPYGKIQYVENYVALPYPILCFHLPKHDIVDVPLWSMSGDPGPVLSVLLEKRVRIVTVK